MYENTSTGSASATNRSSQSSMTETLNEAAHLADKVLAELNEAHGRLFGYYALPPSPVSLTDKTTPQEQPNAASLAVQILSRLWEMGQAVSNLHQAI